MCFSSMQIENKNELLKWADFLMFLILNCIHVVLQNLRVKDPVQCQVVVVPISFGHEYLFNELMNGPAVPAS